MRTALERFFWVITHRDELPPWHFALFITAYAMIFAGSFTALLCIASIVRLLVWWKQ